MGAIFDRKTQPARAHILQPNGCEAGAMLGVLGRGIHGSGSCDLYIEMGDLGQVLFQIISNIF